MKRIPIALMALFFAAWFAIAAPLSAAAQETAKTAPPSASSSPKFRQSAWILRLTPRLHDDKAWTKADGELVSRHAKRLKALHAQGKVVFAGRAATDGAHTFGIVVLAPSVDSTEARALMLADDAVAGGIMTAELVPFDVFLAGSLPATPVIGGQ